ncbi:hypothetical protein SANTM175S_09014 [Streptomyces antimycoticus]
MPRRLTSAAAAARRHWTRIRAASTDAGYSVTEWVIITAGGATIAGLIYAAINGKVLEKIGIINGS